jgi:hypothetical protein
VIRATRRGALAGALALPAAAAIAKSATRAPNGTVVLYDATFQGARSFAASAQLQEGASALRITGDRIRFARTLFARMPALVVGVSRSADALLIEDVAREAGYVPVSISPALAGMLHKTSARGWALAPRR